MKERAISLNEKANFKVLIYENVFYKGSGTMFFHDVYDSIVVVDKFCSLENYNLTEGQFVDFHSSINATITRGSILNGGSTATSTAMIVQNYGDSVLSYTNITHCYLKQDAAFVYGNVQSSANISYCQIEKIDSDDRLSTIDNCLGYIERSHYLNNTQNASDKGIITVNIQTLEIYDSLFLNNQQNEIGYLFDADDYGSITICRCFIQQDINYWNDSSICGRVV
ncbi:hypothetical protein TVAG_485130 [Trichomonas vaginalis G3]|uniref:Right handed beta helix domain-containing protein n=1 Tax=Trichomonas vaginalis (strain ATCC PRA-98 / G3) TaxID=412133 RepID=A2EZ29_TRIV3|nr:hypothetical protein TVAGG3_0754030 [Trichomonas vaginalis G3]EAY02078.1 hypothetical protein TVAG_485130 [Trichomonas vaginalis G3]KAI5512742.1 hypothetical protein TVAGG3_0754030 [Trichomonas vaginalis G3]|eukprot:XP_001330531.1 hypothetical protein [Trichomonas vaginalis G3]